MIRKTYLFITVFFLSTAYGFSLSWNDIHFSSGLSTDYYTGEVREIVYSDSGWANNYLSELIWEIDNVLMLTGDFSASIKDFTLQLSGSTALNKGTGEMDDYDWGDSTTKKWTNWSNSDIFLDKSFIFNSSLNYNISIADNLFLPIGIGYKLNYLNWSDKAEKFIYYGTWDSSGVFYYYDTVNHIPETGTFGGAPGINYTFVQNIFSLTTGICFSYSRFSSRLILSFSPYIYSWDLDHHIMRNIYFVDIFTANAGYYLRETIRYYFDKQSSILLSLKYEEMHEVKGDTYIYNEDPSYATKPDSSIINGAGLASKIINISIGYTYQF